MGVTTIGELYTGQILLEANGVLYTVYIECSDIREAEIQDKASWFKSGMFVQSTPEKNKKAETILEKSVIRKNGDTPEKPIDKSEESATIKSQSNADYGVPGMKWGERKAEEPKKGRFKKADYEKVLVGSKTKDGHEIKSFHPHALMRAQSRDIYPSSIKKAIDHPDKIIKGNTGNRSVYIRKGTWVIYDHDEKDIRTVIYKGGK